MQTSRVPSFDCAIAHATTAPDALNHVEVYLTQNRVGVWTSDTSPDGINFPNLHMLWQGDVALSFSRGYVSLALRNHATMKYWLGSAATVRWDNVGFDGPVVTGWREYSAPDSLTAYRGLPGCTMAGTACAFMEFFPAIGGAGAGAGLLNQAIDVDLEELRDGDNLVELQAAGTWPGSYRIAVTGVDLVLQDR